MTVTLPTSMTAVGFESPGAPDVLRPEEWDVPRPGANEVLVRVAFAGVNRPDVIQRQGHYPPPPGASPIPGLEVADHCLPVPPGLPLAEAAALPETLFTVWHNVFERGWAREGESLLVHGGTSGIGTMATMLGKLFGLTVIVTCGTREKCDRASDIGADHAINYKTTDFVEEVARITGGRGVDLVLDMVSGDYVPRNLKCLAEDGRHVTIAVLDGAKTQLNMAVVMQRRYTLTGSTLRPRSDEFKALVAQEIARQVWPIVEAGDLRPVMDRTFPLADAAEAHARMEAGEHIGKIVLEA